jgi:flagellar FliL protein
MANMSDETIGDDELDAAKNASGSKKKRILALALVGIVSLGGGLGAAVMLKGGSQAQDTEHPVEEAGEHHEAEGAYTFTHLDEMIVNITGFTESGRKVNRFMKISMSIVHSEDATARLADRMPFVRDSIQDYLRQLTERDIQGSIGLATLRSEIMKRVNIVLNDQVAMNILIGDLVIQ